MGETPESRDLQNPASHTAFLSASSHDTRFDYEAGGQLFDKRGAVMGPSSPSAATLYKQGKSEDRSQWKPFEAILAGDKLASRVLRGRQNSLPRYHFVPLGFFRGATSL